MTCMLTMSGLCFVLCLLLTGCWRLPRRGMALVWTLHGILLGRSLRRLTRSGVLMFALQALDVEYRLPPLLFAHLVFERGHSARHDPVGNDPIDFARRASVNCAARQISRFHFHRGARLGLCAPVRAVARSAILIKQSAPTCDVLLSYRQRVLQLLGARRSMRVSMFFLGRGAWREIDRPYRQQRRRNRPGDKNLLLPIHDRLLLKAWNFPFSARGGSHPCGQLLYLAKESS